ncbi:MAG: zinc-ribbon domain-containing protein [Promethearchaeota archaeon]
MFSPHNNNIDQPSPRKVPVWGIIMIIGGMFIFVFGGLAPLITVNIGTMFIFIGLGAFLFMCGGVLTSVKMLKNRFTIGTSQFQDKAYDNFSGDQRSAPKSYDSYGTYKSHSDYSSKSSSNKGDDKTLLCQYCGSANKSDDKFCSTCGSQLH